ncbi:MAG TPA: hypothetical protein VG308_01550 [Stellaceae bacterium]|nr:hypothetical protein [Stellaceae bacterium]
MTAGSAASRRPRLAGLACVLVMLLAAAVLSGCGKKGNPTAPPGEPDTYPLRYPKS